MIIHSDQGSQFTLGAFLARLQIERIMISRADRNWFYDNTLVKRLRLTDMYEELYLHAYSDGWETVISRARFLWRHCHLRPHSSLGGRSTHEAYTEAELCSSRPESTMSRARTVQ